jgi:hypothetical protein
MEAILTYFVAPEFLVRALGALLRQPPLVANTDIEVCRKISRDEAL